MNQDQSGLVNINKGGTSLHQEIRNDLSWIQAAITVVVVMVYLWDTWNLIAVAGFQLG